MPYKIAFLSKYPPLEGGIAAKTYWLTRGLAMRGHVVHIITHGSSAGQEYRIQDDDYCPPQIPNLWIHQPSEKIPWHIPEDNENTLALLDLTINVIREHKVQILDTGYLVPYGIMGHLAKELTGIPHIIRHGGSDLEKFLKKQVLGTVITEAISSADRVVTDTHYRGLLEPITSRVVIQSPYVPDDSVFTSSGIPHPQYRLAAIGKINYHWRHKSLHLIADIMRQLTGQFECWVVGQGKGMTDFQQSLSYETSSSLTWRPFVPPWEMPNVLNQLDAIFVFESNLPHQVFSNMVLEAAWMGVGIITDRYDFADTYRDIVTFNKNQVLVVSPTDSELSAELITRWVQDRISTEPGLQPRVSFQEFLLSNEVVYTDVLNNVSG